MKSIYEIFMNIHICENFQLSLNYSPTSFPFKKHRKPPSCLWYLTEPRRFPHLSLLRVLLKPVWSLHSRGHAVQRHRIGAQVLTLAIYLPSPWVKCEGCVKEGILNEVTRKLHNKASVHYKGRFVLKYFNFMLAEYFLYFYVTYAFMKSLQ